MHDVNQGVGHTHASGQSSSAIGADDLFAGWPSLNLQLKLRLIDHGRPLVIRRMLLFVLLTWLPLLILTGVEGNLYSSEPRRAFLLDFGALARYVIAGPLLFVAEAVCIRVLSDMARRFAELCPATAADQSGLIAALASIRKLRDAPLAAIGFAAIVCAISVAAIRSVPLSDLPLWHASGTDGVARSWAGWWSSLVSLPLLLLLLMSWIWRLLLWTRFLLLVSRLNLNLIPTHPDKSAGVGFIGYSLRAFCLAGSALGAIVAGAVANQVLHDGAGLADFNYMVAGVVVFTVVLFTAPLLTFSRKLAGIWARGVHDYGKLASDFGRQFELEWFGGGEQARKSMLDRGDFSAATDLYQVADRIHDLRIVPVDLLSVVALAGATLLPFVPIVFIVFPFDALLKGVVGLFM